MPQTHEPPVAVWLRHGYGGSTMRAHDHRGMGRAPNGPLGFRPIPPSSIHVYRSFPDEPSRAGRAAPERARLCATSTPDRMGGADRRAHRSRRCLLVRRLAGRVRAAVPAAGRWRHHAPPEPRAAAQQLSRMQRPERRGARRGPHLHLQREEGGRRPDQQLDGPARDARHAAARLRNGTPGLFKGACAAARCTWCRSRWGRSARISRRSASNSATALTSPSTCAS